MPSEVFDVGRCRDWLADPLGKGEGTVQTTNSKPQKGLEAVKTVGVGITTKSLVQFQPRLLFDSSFALVAQSKPLVVGVKRGVLFSNKLGGEEP